MALRFLNPHQLGEQAYAGVIIHRVESQVQEVETRQGGDGGEGIVVHQTVAGQVELPGAKNSRTCTTKM